MNAIQHYIIYFSLVPVAATALIGVVRYRGLALTQRYLLMLTLLALLMELATRAILFYLPSNLFLAPIDAVLEFTLLALIYRHELQPARISRFIPLLALFFFIGSALTYTPRLDFPYFNSLQRFIESLLVLAFVGAYFHREINRRVFTRRLEHEPIFWISTGLLLYFLSSMFIFLTSNYVLTQPRELGMRVWAIHALLYIFLNVLYAIAMLLSPRAGQRHTIVT